jgi:hypothetical protein
MKSTVPEILILLPKTSKFRGPLVANPQFTGPMFIQRRSNRISGLQTEFWRPLSKLQGNVGTDYINHYFVKVKQDGDLPLCFMQHQTHSFQKTFGTSFCFLQTYVSQSFDD